MKNVYVKILVNVVILIVLLVLIDIIVGWAGEKYMKWLNKEPRDGDAALVNYDLNAAAPDIAIVGNSTAICHYIPEIIHDSLYSYVNKDYCVFNMGMSKQRMSYNYYSLRCLLDRTKPTLVIANVWASYLNIDEESQDFGEFRPYVNVNNNIKDMFRKHNQLSLATRCNMYCYNTELVKLLLSPLKTKGANGFKASYVKVDELEKASVFEDTIQLSQISVSEFDAMLNLAIENDVLLAVVLSPTMGHISDTTSLSYCYMRRRCQKEGVIFLDYTHDSLYYNKDFYRDITHMNYYGAECFTKKLMSDLKPMIKEKLK